MTTRYTQRLGPVPSHLTDAVLRTHLQEVADAVNALPPFSTFSYTTPESNVTASVPTVGINLASGVSRVWVKVTGDGNTGWNPLA